MKKEKNLKNFCKNHHFSYPTLSEVENRARKVPKSWVRHLADIIDEEETLLFDEDGLAQKWG